MSPAGAPTASRLERPGAPSIKYAVHLPEGEPEGAVLVVHGYAEHSGRYGEVVEALTARGLAAATFDLRGHGHSAGPRGHVERFGDYVRDVDDLLEALGRREAWRRAGPPVLIGHSLGGLVSFHVALADPGLVRGLVLSSPYFGLALPVPASTRAAARALSRLRPTFSLPTGLRGRDVTKDRDRARAYDDDPLVFPEATARFFTESIAAQARALELAPSLRVPLLVLQAADDKVASAAASRALFERVGSRRKEYRSCEGCYHEIFNEPGRERWVREAADAALAFCADEAKPAP
ncbi:MAG TPA: alpha/beta hydrolase [Polyangiaceae bacterium]|nr:alpha/beta hydrolase [Polyangiaceae bacterium]